MIYTVTVNPSIDRHVRLPANLRRGRMNRALSVSETAAGKGINVSRTLTALGVPNRVWAVLGGVSGRLLRARLRESGIGASVLWTRQPTRLNLKLYTDGLGTPTQINESGPRLRQREIAAFSQMLLESSRRPQFWAFSGSLCPGFPADFYARMVRRLQHNKVRCLVDADGAALKEAVAAKPYMIKPNEEEMRQLCGKPLSTVEDFACQGEALVRRGIRLVVISMGRRGALFLSAKEVYHAHLPPVEPLSDVGSGDALVGGILAGFHNRMPLKEIARWSVAVAARAVRHAGPFLKGRAELKRFVRQVRLRVL